MFTLGKFTGEEVAREEADEKVDLRLLTDSQDIHRHLKFSKFTFDAVAGLNIWFHISRECEVN